MAGAQGEQRAAMLDHYNSLLQMPRASELDEVRLRRVSTAEDLGPMKHTACSCETACLCFPARAWRAADIPACCSFLMPQSVCVVDLGGSGASLDLFNYGYAAEAD